MLAGVLTTPLILWIFLLMKSSQLIDIIMGNISSQYFPWFGGLDRKSIAFLIYQPIAINQKPNMTSLWFFTLLKVCTETIKNREHYDMALYCHFRIIKENGTWIKKKLEMLFISCTTARPNFILTLPRILKQIESATSVIFLMTSQALMFVDSPATQKPEYLEKKKLFFL